MRKIQFFAFSAAAALALSMTTSCQKEIEQAPVPSSETSTVCFTLSEPDTKTAMGTIGDKVTNIWSSDDKARMTFYQNGTASTAVTITSDDNYKHASFTATFPSATAGSYKYKALLAANKVGDLPVVPAVQHPVVGSFDPDANVLVGLETEAFNSKQSSVNLVYKHAAAISRISFSEIPDGLKIYGVQINASGPIAGVAKSVDYTTGDVNYSTASEKTISLIYNEAPSYSGGTFDAYFVAIPGTATITDIKLVTDKGTFVKTGSNGGVKTTFNVNNFKTLTVATPSTRTFYKASALENGINFMIVNTSSTYYAMKYSSSSFGRQSVSVNGTTLTTSDPSNLLWTAEAVSGSTTNFYLKNGSVYIKKDTKLSTTTSSKASVSFDNSNSRLSYSNSGTYYISYNSSKSPYWQASTSKASVYLYTSKLPASSMLSFSAEAVECPLADKDSFVAPILSGAGNASVTYSSSNTAVATVDKTGAVTINGKGTATITATATFKSNAIYQGGSATASYTLTVTKVETYVKVTEAPSSWAGTYLILSSDDKKLFDYSNTTSGNSFHAASLTETITDNKIVSSDLAKYEVEIIAFDSSSDYEQPNKNGSGKYYWYEATSVTGWKVKVACEDNTYLYSYGGGTPEKPVQTGIEPTSGRIYYNGFYFNDGQIKMISTRGTDGAAKYLGYHTSNGFYYVGDKELATEPTERVHLYKKQ